MFCSITSYTLHILLHFNLVLLRPIIRWPYGPVAIISPFNFPLEIPVMQFVAAAMVGNKPVVKPESRVGLPVDQFLRLMQHCGLPRDSVDLIHCRGSVMSKLLASTDFRMTQFTGGMDAAHKVTVAMGGRVKLEDAGFDWKVLGPMRPNNRMNPDEVKRIAEYVAWQCDQDAYALSGERHFIYIKCGHIHLLRAKMLCSINGCCP